MASKRNRNNTPAEATDTVDVDVMDRDAADRPETSDGSAPAPSLGAGQSLASMVSLQTVDPRAIRLNPDNERDYDINSEREQSLRKSLLSEGLKKHLEIYEDGTVADGNRRLFVILDILDKGEGAGRFDTLPAVVVPRPTSAAEEIFHRLNTNEARQFSPLEQARAFAKLRDAGMNNTKIASRTPFTSMHIGNMLTLADASDTVKGMVRDGKVSANLAVDVLRKYGEDAESLMAKAVIYAWEAEGKDRATAKHLDAVAPKPETPAPTFTPTSPVAPAGASEGVAEGVAEGTSDPTVGLSNDHPAGHAPVGEEEVTMGEATVAEGESTEATEGGDEEGKGKTTSPRTLNARDVIGMFVPTARDLIDALQNGPKSKRGEAFEAALDNLVQFVQQARQIGVAK